LQKHAKSVELKRLHPLGYVFEAQCSYPVEYKQPTTVSASHHAHITALSEIVYAQMAIKCSIARSA
jgi:hypothetical protein